MLSRCFLDYSVGVEAFVIGLSHTSSFFSLKDKNSYFKYGPHCEWHKILQNYIVTLYTIRDGSYIFK